MQVVAALLDEHRLVDAGVGEGAQVLAELRRCADPACAAAQDLRAHSSRTLCTRSQMFVRPGRASRSVKVAERELEEAKAVGAPAKRFRLVGMAREAGHHRDVWVDGLADRHALALERLVVVRHPVLASAGSTNANVNAPSPSCAAR